jgi:acyl carrier protein
MIPAILSAQQKSVEQMMTALRDLITRARSGRLRSSEITEGTVTVTNLCDLGVETVYGVIYPPQVALIGLVKIVEEALGRTRHARREAGTDSGISRGPPRYRRPSRRSVSASAGWPAAGAREVRTEAEIRQAIFDTLRKIAPEADPRQIRADENLREALDIDSFDFLSVLIGLHERLGVEIPEGDYGQLASVSALEQYLSRKLARSSTIRALGSLAQ